VLILGKKKNFVIFEKKNFFFHFSGRSSQWYENVFGCLLAHNLLSLRDTFTNSKIVKV
jgi:hypothetical protein